MDDKKFDPKKLQKLNNPERLLDTPPEEIWKHLNLNIGELDTFIDIGAGTGFFSVPFVKYIKNGKIYACDISELMVNWMTSNICPKYPNIIPIRMEENTIILQDELADLVYMINLHHELNSPEQMLKEAYRLLKRAGKIFIVDWKKEEMPQGPPVEIRYKPEKVQDQLLKAGFEDVNIYNEMQKHFLLVARKDS